MTDPWRNAIALVALLAVMAGCGGGDPVRRAVTKSLGEPSFGFRVRETTQLPDGGKLRVELAGNYAPATRTGAVGVTGVSEPILLRGDAVYLPPAAAGTAGTQLLKADREEAAALIAGRLGDHLLDPASYLRVARPSGEREERGEEVVDGDPATQYRLDRVGPPVDVWVDADGHVRRVRFTRTSTAPGAPGEQEVIVELGVYGEDFDAPDPPAFIDFELAADARPSGRAAIVTDYVLAAHTADGAALCALLTRRARRQVEAAADRFGVARAPCPAIVAAAVEAGGESTIGSGIMDIAVYQGLITSAGVRAVALDGDRVAGSRKAIEFEGRRIDRFAPD